MAYEVLVNGKMHRVKVLERKGTTFLVEINKKAVKVRLVNMGLGKVGVIEIDNKPFETQMKRIQGSVLQIKTGGRVFRAQIESRPNARATAPTSHLKPIAAVTRRPSASSPIEKDALIAPLAGRIAALMLQVGQRVERGDIAFVLEAMKMENEIAVPRAGIVKEIRVSEGTVVNKGDVLAVIS